MSPKRNLRSVFAQYRNLSTGSRRNLSSSRSSKVWKGAGRRDVASGGGSKFDDFKSSIAYGNLAFFCWGVIEMLEYHRTVLRYLKERDRHGSDGTSMPRDLLDWLLNK